MPVYTSSVSPKGQVTIPAEIRERFEIKTADRVEFEVVDDKITIVPLRAKLRALYGSIRPVDPSLSWKEREKLAIEEHVAHVMSEGLDPADDSTAD
jgi:AbrB family looped-hinge helix DNA binding protein